MRLLVLILLSLSPGLDASTVCGYFVLLMIQFQGCFSYIMALSVPIMFFIDACYYLRACCTEFEQVFVAIDKSLAERNTKLVAAAVEKRLQYAIVLHVKTAE